MSDAYTTTPPCQAAVVAAGELSRTDRYVADLDATLATLPSDKARGLLSREFVRFTAEYERFVAESYRPTPEKPNGLTAFDFIMTISEIGKRIAQYRAELPTC